MLAFRRRLSRKRSREQRAIGSILRARGFSGFRRDDRIERNGSSHPSTTPVVRGRDKDVNLRVSEKYERKRGRASRQRPLLIHACIVTRQGARYISSADHRDEISERNPTTLLLLLSIGTISSFPRDQARDEKPPSHRGKINRPCPEGTVMIIPLTFAGPSSRPSPIV